MDQAIAWPVFAAASALTAMVMAMAAYRYRRAARLQRARADALSALCVQVMLDDNVRIDALDEYARLHNIVILRASPNEQARRLGDADDPSWLRDADLIMRIPDMVIVKGLGPDRPYPDSGQSLRQVAGLLHRRALDAAKGKFSVVQKS